jgi:hypothetical protein
MKSMISNIVYHGQNFTGIDFFQVTNLMHSVPVESGLQSALNRHTVRLFTEGDDTRGCNNTICPPEDEQGTDRNMLRIIM